VTSAAEQRSIRQAESRPVLDVRRLTTTVEAPTGDHAIVDDVSIRVGAGEWVGLVGESGSGKTMTAMSIARLLPPVAAIRAGTVELAGEDLVLASDDRMREVRGRSVGVIFQDPSAALNPLMTIGQHLSEAITAHSGMGRGELRDAVLHRLRQVQMPNAARLVDEYPHRLSGGMKQRAMIAIAIANQPLLLIADEPTTSLDVTIQSQIMDLLASLRDELGVGILLITHDLGLVAQYCDSAYVMYAGRVVEQANAGDLFERPGHPYSEALLDATLDAWHPRTIRSIPGRPPEFSAMPAGCRFAPRCRYTFDRCREEEPPLIPFGAGASRCWLRDDG
jgi:peptide/nickel transport system ATP-binding protein